MSVVKPPPEQMFKEFAKLYHSKCHDLFKKYMGKLVWVLVRYIVFGALFWFLLYMNNTRISKASFIVYYNILFLLLAVVSYLFGITGIKPGSEDEQILGIEKKKSALMQLLNGIVAILSIPSRGTIETFLSFSDPLFNITKNLFIFGMRFIHSLRQEVPLDFVYDLYQPLISRNELNKIFRFLKFTGLINFVKKKDQVFIQPTKVLLQTQLKYAEPATEFPGLRETTRLTGVINYLQDRSKEVVS